MFQKTTIFCAVLWMTLSGDLAAQNWDVLQARGGSGLEVLDHVLPGGSNEHFLAGRFSSSFSWGDTEFIPLGGIDLFFGLTDEEGEWLWNYQAGSMEDDEILALAAENGALSVLGSYRGQLDLDDLQLISPQGNKSLFLCRATGSAVAWAVSMDGKGLKGGGELRATAGNLWMTGFFGDTLRILDTRLDALGDTDAMLLRFDAEGRLLQSLTFGGSGDARGRQFLPLPDGDLLLAGVFNGILIAGDTTLTAGTFDNDIFILRLGPQGELRWARRLGGVLDNEITGLELTPTGAIVLSGYFSGLLRMEPDISLQSTNAQPDGFIALLDQQGQAIKALSFGGTGNVRALDLHQQGENLALAGTFNGLLQAGPFQVSSTGQQSGFAVTLDEDLTVGRLMALRSDEVVFLSSITGSSEGDLITGGSYSGKLELQSVPEANQLDILLARKRTLVSTQEIVSEETEKWRFSQTGRAQIQLLNPPADCGRFRLLDLQGRLLRSGSVPPDGIWQLGELPSGIYLLYLQCGERGQVHRFGIY